MSPRRAAQYLRMSTEHQKYSLQHQAVTIATYAAMRGCEVVRTYSDGGISGLRFENRPGLRALLADVLAGQADFDLVLTYDVSRWGRFQDPDQSAHYEFLCREAGVEIVYCAEPFANDQSFAGTIVKQLKRAMAAEYSRELSVKVSIAQWNLAREGYWMGGPAGFGLRRQIVNPDGSPGRVLRSGERKALTTEKTRLAPGPLKERRVVARIFRMLVSEGMRRTQIARRLNHERIPAEDGGPWTPQRVQQVLTNRKYVAGPVFGRSSGRIAQRRRRPVEACIRMPAPYAPFVSLETFEAAQSIIRNRACRKLSEAAMLEGLGKLFEQHGRLTSHLIKAAEHLPCPAIYQRQFGSLLNAYALVGYDPSTRAIKAGAIVRKDQPCNRRNLRPCPSREDLLAALTDLWRERGRLSTSVLQTTAGAPSVHICCKVFGSMRETYAALGYKPDATQQRVMAWWDRRGDTGLPSVREVQARTRSGRPATPRAFAPTL